MCFKNNNYIYIHTEKNHTKSTHGKLPASVPTVEQESSIYPLHIFSCQLCLTVVYPKNHIISVF